MPVRLRITLLFTTMVLIILALVCGSVYTFSYYSRVNRMRTRLTNRAITTARLLSQSEMFPQEVLKKIDASTAILIKHQTVQAYDYLNNRIYTYSDSLNDTISINESMLNRARVEQDIYYTLGTKEAVAYHYLENKDRIVVVAAAYDEEGKLKLRQLALILWISFGGGVFISFAAGYFFSKQLLRPILNISNEVNEISAQNFTRRIHTGAARDEWHYLSQTLNGLLNRLQESFDTQRRFISNASHELSTPLTSILSQLEVTLQRNRDAEHYRKVMQSVFQDVLHMNQLTRTLLEFARASGNPGGLEINLVRIDEVLLRLPTAINKINDGYSVHLSFRNLPEEEGKLLVYGNEHLLFTAFKNIVANACKYSENHQARVTLTCQAGELVTGVEDDGMGIPREELEEIFQPFYRSDNAKGESGFGLGLSLVSHIIKLHKGQTRVSSEVGKGTLFVITLPPAG